MEINQVKLPLLLNHCDTVKYVFNESVKESHDISNRYSSAGCFRTLLSHNDLNLSLAHTRSCFHYFRGLYIDSHSVPGDKGLFTACIDLILLYPYTRSYSTNTDRLILLGLVDVRSTMLLRKQAHVPTKWVTQIHILSLLRTPSTPTKWLLLYFLHPQPLIWEMLPSAIKLQGKELQKSFAPCIN